MCNRGPLHIPGHCPPFRDIVTLSEDPFTIHEDIAATLAETIKEASKEVSADWESRAKLLEGKLAFVTKFLKDVRANSKFYVPADEMNALIDAALAEIEKSQ